MREIFTTNGYAILDNHVKLSTPNGLASLDQLSRDLLAGGKIVIESLQDDFRVREQRDADLMPTPGAIQIDQSIAARLIADLEATFASRKEVTIPRLCFSSVLAILARLQKKHRVRLQCDVDNKVYPCELSIVAGAKSETQLLSITDVIEEEVTALEMPPNCRAMVIDGLICS